MILEDAVLRLVAKTTVILKSLVRFPKAGKEEDIAMDDTFSLTM
jgi:hypothetical protein